MSRQSVASKLEGKLATIIIERRTNLIHGTTEMAFDISPSRNDSK